MSKHAIFKWGKLHKKQASCYRCDIRSAKPLVAILAILLTIISSRASAQNRGPWEPPIVSSWKIPSSETIAHGKADFIKYCAPCHSENGKGGGPEAKVIPGIKPSDLTTISRRHGGVFPYQQVADIIDGRELAPPHERFDMPFWGVRAQQPGQEFTPASEARAKARLEAVVDYIATIQQR